MDPSELVTITVLKRRVAEGQGRFRVHVQVDSVAQRTTRGDKEFLEVRAADAEDSFVLRVWGDSPAFAEATQWAAGTLLEIAGEWSSGKFGLEPRAWTARLLDEAEGDALMGGGADLRERQARDYEFIRQTVGTMNDPRMRSLCELFLEVHGARFRRTAAARNYHHARRGGLVEHVAQMMRSALALGGAYPQLNLDLLLAGVLFHDCGKLWETCYAESGFAVPCTLTGEMLGHIPIGMELVNRLWHDMIERAGDDAAHWKDAAPSDDEVRLHLLHLVGSHHGEYEFGSPVLPKTPEAVALHHIDNIDAKLEMFFRGYLTSAEIARGIYERVRPLPGNLVRPLGKFQAPETERVDGETCAPPEAEGAAETRK